MPSFSIKDVPEDLADKLRQRAARNHRSLQGELMAILRQAADEEAADSHDRVNAASGGSLVPAPAEPPRGATRGSRTIAEVAAEMRRLFPEHRPKAPRSVELIRRERDARSR